MGLVFREKATGKVAAVFENCLSESPVFNNAELYDKEETRESVCIDPSLQAPPIVRESLEEKIRRIAKEEVANHVI